MSTRQLAIGVVLVMAWAANAGAQRTRLSLDPGWLSARAPFLEPATVKVVVRGAHSRSSETVP